MFSVNYEKWLEGYKNELCGKRVALFGSTGGIGKELCRYILRLGGTLLTVDRNPQRAAVLKSTLKAEFPDGEIINLTADLENFCDVKRICGELTENKADIIIHNAGAYSIPRKKLSTGLDNVFQINFAAPYYITRILLPYLDSCGGRVVLVGSVAHNYSKTDIADLDFSTRKKASLVYGNAKRYLMFATPALFENSNAKIAVTHPGITFTNITAHYPKWLFAIIKHPMKVIFMPPRSAALSILEGCFKETEPMEWIGPAVFDVWGKPLKRRVKTCAESEYAQILSSADMLFTQLDKI